MNKLKRNYCVEQALGYARMRNVAMTQAWLDKAMRWAPLTEMQVWSIEQKMRSIDFRKLNLGEGTVEART